MKMTDDSVGLHAARSEDQWGGCVVDSVLMRVGFPSSSLRG